MRPTDEELRAVVNELTYKRAYLLSTTLLRKLNQKGFTYNNRLDFYNQLASAGYTLHDFSKAIKL